MTLEAALGDLATLAEPAGVARFVEQAADNLRAIATALREQRQTGPLPDLRALQRQLAGATREGGDPAAAELLARISDRLVDNVDTLAHVISRSPPTAVHGTPD
jgi:hypothetical protein